ncbi:hypothetical protein ACJ2A9_23410 [Anaerobacillus sp. MEB173]
MRKGLKVFRTVLLANFGILMTMTFLPVLMITDNIPPYQSFQSLLK